LDQPSLQAHGPYGLSLSLFQLLAELLSFLARLFILPLQQGSTCAQHLQLPLHFFGQTVADIQGRLHGPPFALLLSQLLTQFLQLILLFVQLLFVSLTLGSVCLLGLFYLLTQSRLNGTLLVDLQQCTALVGLGAFFSQFNGFLQTFQILGELFTLAAQLLLNQLLFSFQLVLALFGVQQVLF